MAKGFIDRKAGRDRVKERLLAQHGGAFEPPGGWDGFFGPDEPIKDVRCQMCGQMVAEVRPFGPNHESICEACADKDPELSEQRHRALNPNG